MLANCHWPPLAARFDAALRDAVAFIFQEVQPAGVIATGTIVRGTPHAGSDLDIYVVHEAPYRRRVQRFFSGVPAEIFISPPSAIRRYFAEEHADGRKLTAHMLATGFVVFERGTITSALLAEARQWLARSSEVGEHELTATRYSIASALEDASDVAASDPASASMMFENAVTGMLELHCKRRAGRIPRRKDLLELVTATDTELGALARRFFLASGGERAHLAAEIADRAIGARGFFPWDSGESPVP